MNRSFSLLVQILRNLLTVSTNTSPDIAPSARLRTIASLGAFQHGNKICNLIMFLGGTSGALLLSCYSMPALEPYDPFIIAPVLFFFPAMAGFLIGLLVSSIPAYWVKQVLVFHHKTQKDKTKMPPVINSNQRPKPSIVFVSTEREDRHATHDHALEQKSQSGS